MKKIKINEFTTKFDLKNMIGGELDLKLKGKPTTIVITDVGGNTVSIMRKKDGSSAKLKTDQFLHLVNKSK